MHLIRLALLLAACGAALAAPAFAQAPQEATPPFYAPESGQEGKDVPWVPTPQILVDTMLDMARVTPADFLMDLGSGDGRTVITAARRGVRALGIEYNPDMVVLSQRNAEKAGVAGMASFRTADLFETDLSEASVITMFLLTTINLQLRPRILALKPGTRIVSNSFDMGDWIPDAKEELLPDPRCDVSWCTALLWIVPAQVAGSYKLPQGELVLEQQYQMLSGSLRTGGATHAVEGKVTGADIFFTAGGREYRGRLEDRKLVLR